MNDVGRYLRRSAEILAVQWDGSPEHASRIIDWVISEARTATYHCSTIGACLGRDTHHTIRIRTDSRSLGEQDVNPGDYVIWDPNHGFSSVPMEYFVKSFIPLTPPVGDGTTLFPEG